MLIYLSYSNFGCVFEAFVFFGFCINLFSVWSFFAKRLLHGLDLKVKAKYRATGIKKLFTLVCIRAFHASTIADIHSKSCEHLVIIQYIVIKVGS